MNTLNYTPKDPAIAAELDSRLRELDVCIQVEGRAYVSRVLDDVFAASVAENQRNGRTLDEADLAELRRLVREAVLGSSALDDAMLKIWELRQDVAATMTSQAIVADAQARGRT